MMPLLSLGRLLLLACAIAPAAVEAFHQPSLPPAFFAINSRRAPFGIPHNRGQSSVVMKASSSSSSSPVLTRVAPDVEGIPIPFVDHTGKSFIECYADSVAHVDGVEYTIGVPCDYAVALTYFDKSKDQLVPIELDEDELMDDIFPIAAQIVTDEFGEELVLQRTPQTLTLVGELEDDDDDEEEFVDDPDLTIDDDDDENDEEEVEVLLSFEHRGKDFHLVRLLDPILLVGKVDNSSKSSSSDDSSSPASENRVLLTPEESKSIMPLLENMFLEFHDDPDNLFA